MLLDVLLGQQIKCGQGTTTSHSVLCSAGGKIPCTENNSLSPPPPALPPASMNQRSKLVQKADKDPLGKDTSPG